MRTRAMNKRLCCWGVRTTAPATLARRALLMLMPNIQMYDVAYAMLAHFRPVAVANDIEDWTDQSSTNLAKNCKGSPGSSISCSSDS